MNIRRHLLSNVFRSPDDPAADPTVVVDPALTADPLAPDPEPAPPPAPAGQPWYMERLSERSAEVATERAAREAAERRAEDAEALAARLSAPRDPAAPPAPQPTPVTRQPGQTTEDFQRAVREEAANQRFMEESVKVRDAGLSKFPDFNNSLNILTAIKFTDNEIIKDLMAVDKENAHVILDALAKDPDRAVSLTKMDARSRTAELTRMSMALAQKLAPAADPAPVPAAAASLAARKVSAAPKPTPALAPVAEDEQPELGDHLSEDEFSRKWDEKFKKRA